MNVQGYARVAHVSINPGMDQAFLEAFRNQGVPTLYALGCLKVDVYLEPDGRRGMVVSHWPTREAAEEFEHHTAREDLRLRLAEMCDARGSVQIMDKVIALD